MNEQLIVNQGGATVEAAGIQEEYINTPTIPFPTAVPSFSPTFAPTFTFEPAPILSTSDEKDLYVLNLIETNGDCEIPCLWGIKVGTSAWQDVNQPFNPLVVLNPPKKEGNQYIIRYGKGMFDFQSYTFFVVISGDSNKVQSLSAFFYLLPEPGWENYIFAVKERFSLQEILEIHGYPSSVYLKSGVQYEQGGGIDSKMVLVYQEFGFAIEYNQSNKISLELGHRPDHLFCFNEDWLESIKLLVTTSKGENSLLIQAQIYDQFQEGYLVDFREATNLSMEDFYNRVLIGDQELCFELLKH